MKKLLVVLCLLCLLTACLGCKNTSENVKEKQKTAVNTESYIENDIEKNGTTDEQSLEQRIKSEKEKFAQPELPADNIYINSKCGYKFEFPKEWLGWYFVNDTTPDYVTVRFYGKSMRGTVAEKYYFENADYGLRMFFIMSEQRLNEGEYDNVKLLGNVDGVNYYYATTTDVSIALLHGEGRFWFDEDLTEQELMKSDCEKVHEMYDFCTDSDNVKNAFGKI